ncbi:MAG: SLC13 family permease, partial [Bacteroidales bacterium]|nr:SLC13 family permease [Bacteroidales bacterium]
SVSVLIIMLLTTSTSMFAPLNPVEVDAATKEVLNPDVAAAFGTPIKYKDILATFADPVIMLFLGGFVLAITASKYKLDAIIARNILKPFGNKSQNVLLGFIVVTALCSMFMSNTATTAMMLTILTPVLAQMPEGGKGKIAMALAIPVAANIGGIGTPIGTPPNAIAKGFLEQNGIEISFASWMMVMIPMAIVILIFAWFLLMKMFPFTQKTIEIEIKEKMENSVQAKIAVITLIVTVLLWVTDQFTGINSNVVALIPFGVFAVTGIFKKEDLKKIDWDVLWLVAGGFALGVGLAKTGLDKHLVEAIPFGSWSPLVVILGSGILCYIMSNLMSHSATASLLLPILAVVAKGMENELQAFGGVPTMLVGIALTASFAMILPISTPPNALAYAKGFIKQKDMATVGIIIGVVSIALAYTVLISLKVF